MFNSQGAGGATISSLTAIGLLLFSAGVMWFGARLTLFAVEEAWVEPGRWAMTFDEWRDTAGLRDRARSLIDNDKDPFVLPSAALARAESVVEVDPTNSSAWLDVAIIAARRKATTELFQSAVKMSEITGPYESGVMARRIVFLVDHWDQLAAQSKEICVSDLGRLFGVTWAPYQSRIITFLRQIPVATATELRATAQTHAPQLDRLLVRILPRSS
ncbi:MAG: hypothetical protein K0S56_110 [Microvirga sp.]|jgi:hypothetical protein|nr:hypothetical protein [Microvirga sp.]